MEDNSNWVEKFKRISWEPEILISGGMLFTLLQAKSALVVVHNQFYPLGLHGFKIILIFFTLSISALTLWEFLCLIKRVVDLLGFSHTWCLGQLSFQKNKLTN